MKHIVIFVLFLILFIIRWKMVQTNSYPNRTQLQITASLRQEPQLKGNLQVFNLAGINIKTWKFPNYHYGMRLKVAGIVKNGEIELPQVEIIDQTRDEGILGLVLELRRRIEGIYKRSLPEPQASLLSGIILGSKSSLDKNFSDALRNTGVMHVVVASGMNVMIIGSTTLTILLYFLSRKRAIFVSLIVIWFYVLLAGAEVPVVRAGIMGSIVFIAQVIGREADAWRALALSGGVLLLFNPLNLLDLGFQLSFMATLGILAFTARLDKLFARVPRQIRGDLSQTLSAQFMTLPIILSNFGSYPVLSPLVNITISFVIVWIMRLGLIVGVAGLVFLPLGQLLAFLVLPLLTYFVEIVRFFARL